jgi:hypothetical protein
MKCVFCIVISLLFLGCTPSPKEIFSKKYDLLYKDCLVRGKIVKGGIATNSQVCFFETQDGGNKCYNSFECEAFCIWTGSKDSGICADSFVTLGTFKTFEFGQRFVLFID